MRYTPLLFQGGPWPIRELALRACRLDPKAQHRDACTLGLIHWVIDASGQPQRLAPVGGRVGGGYGRVSLDLQRYLYSRANQNRLLVGGEFSELDQFEQIINHFISRKQVFILYNDSGCSGAWPVDDKRLIKRMLQKKAKRYEQVFRSIMIESRLHRLDPDAIRAMEDYLTETIGRILSGSRVGE